MRQVSTLLLLVCSQAGAQLSSPIVGYSLSSSKRAVRLIYGIPGSTHYSESIAWPAEGVHKVCPAPGHRWLLTTDLDGTLSAWVPETGGLHRLANRGREPDLVGFSPSGEAVALYWRGNNRLEVHAGLPGNPAVTGVETAGEWNSLLLSDDGRQVAGLSESGDLWLLLVDGHSARRLIRTAGPVPTVTFLADSNTVAMAEDGSDQIELIANLREGTFTRRILTLPRPLGASAQFMPGDRDWFLVIDPSARVGYRVDLAGAIQTLEIAHGAKVQTLRPSGSLLLSVPGHVGRIAVSREAETTWHYLPGLIEAESVEQEEEKQ